MWTYSNCTLFIIIEYCLGERKGGWDSPHGSGSESASELKRQLREKDENIMRLEGECAKWEQRFLEENALRQAAIDAASIPK